MGGHGKPFWEMREMNAGNGEKYLYDAVNRKRDFFTVCYYSMAHAGMVRFSP